MNAYEKAQQLGLTGTDDEVFKQLQVMGLSHHPINRAELVHVLNLLGMLRKRISNNADEKWTGTVLAMQDAIEAGGTDEQKKGMALWLSHITNPTNLLWDTTQKEFAAGFWDMYQAFRDKPGMPTTEDFITIAALGGGWIATTLEDFTAQREAAEKQAADEAKAEAEAAVRSSKQSALAEANDICIHLIDDIPSSTQAEVLAAFTTRLSETWPA